MDFKDINSALKYVQQQVDKSLETNVAKYAKDEIQVAVDSEIYMSGKPVSYDRRGSRDGEYMGNTLGTGSLADQNKMKSIVNNGELIVTDEADFNYSSALGHGFGDIDLSKSLAENIEYGYGDMDHWYNKPRRFMEKASENIKQSGECIKIIKNDLKSKGIKCE